MYGHRQSGRRVRVVRTERKHAEATKVQFQSRPVDLGRLVIQASGYRGSGLVLVVDDEPDILETTADFLQSLGFEVIQAEDGRDAVERFARHLERIRLVLLDYSMPHMDGAECFRRIRELSPSIPVLMTSGFSEGDTARALEGLAGFLQKPYDFARLRAKMQEVLG
jgi:DNA-binding response OmpR family regulator